MAGSLHPVQQPAVLAAGEAVQGERRAQDVVAEPLATVAIAARRCGERDLGPRRNAGEALEVSGAPPTRVY